MTPIRLIRKRLLPRNTWGDREFCRRRFVRQFGRAPNPHCPRRYTDYIYKIKTDGSLLDPLCQFLTDKELAKIFIENICGHNHLLQSYKVLRNVHDINTFVPDRFPFVAKPTHLSGPVLFYTDPEQRIDRETFVSWLSQERYSTTREANYRHLRPKIIIEEFFSEDGVNAPKDYKFFCFHGDPKIIQVDNSRFQDHTRNFYDTSWHRLPITMLFPNGPDCKSPPLLTGMISLASRLASNFSFVRVDLYASETRICVGELTFCPGGANEPLLPDVADIELARLFRPDYQLDARACADAWNVK